MKACQIFKTKSNYKIVTMYHTDTGSYKLADPISILPSDSDVETIAKSLFSSLEASKEIINPNESRAKELLQKLGEKSYKSFYSKSKSCMLFLEGGKVVCEPQFYSVRIDALEVDKENIREFELSKGELYIASEIKQIID